MGKSVIRVLPPLVNGKVSGVLEFGVDYVEITEKLFKSEDTNFLVQIIWWGETKPLLIRSKKIKFFTKDNKQVIVDEHDGYTVKYEVRTNIKLFRSYLSKCDEVEVAVIDSVKNEIIGSTLLKDLIHLVYNVESFTNSVISDSGDEIGKITCHFKFCEADSGVQSHKLWTSGIDHVPIEKCNNNDLKINLNLTELNSSRDDFQNLYESSRTNKENKSAKSINIHYNSPVARISDLASGHSQRECSADWNMKNYVINADSELSEEPPNDLEVYAGSDIKCADSENSTKNVICVSVNHGVATDKKNILPPTKSIKSTGKEDDITNRTRISNLKHPTKVTNKNIPVNTVKDTSTKGVQKSKPNRTNKTVKGVKKVKENSPGGKNLAIVSKCSKTSTKSMVKPIGNMKTFTKISNEISKLNKVYLNVEPCIHSDSENVPVKENVKDEDIERKANEKMQSPGRITDGECRERDKTDSNNVKNSEKVRVNNKLFFDLNDPIEKLYYETFFQKSEAFVNNEFEIAELLNQPGNNYLTQTDPQGGIFERGIIHLAENKLQTEKDVDVSRRSLSPVDVIRTDSSSNDEDADRGCDISHGKKSLSNDLESCGHENSKSKPVKEYKTDCHRCKYYKKLSELDKIIDALKNFETKLRTDVSDESEIVLRGDRHDCRIDLPTETQPENESMDNSIPGDMGINSNESDYSKEDSDFIEFRRYLSKR